LLICVKLLEGFSVMRTATVRSPRNRYYLRMWVTLRASAAEIANRTKSRLVMGTPLALPVIDGTLG